jgi:hypothetical protein
LKLKKNCAKATADFITSLLNEEAWQATFDQEVSLLNKLTRVILGHGILLVVLQRVLS